MIWFFYLFVLFLPFQNHYLLNLKLSGDFTVLKAYGVGIILYALVYILFHGVPRVWRTTQAKFFLLFFTQMYLSLFLSASGLLQTGEWEGYEGVTAITSALALLFIVFGIVDNEDKLCGAMLASVAAMGHRHPVP